MPQPCQHLRALQYRVNVFNSPNEPILQALSIVVDLTWLMAEEDAIVALKQSKECNQLEVEVEKIAMRVDEISNMICNENLRDLLDAGLDALLQEIPRITDQIAQLTSRAEAKYDVPHRLLPETFDMRYQELFPLCVNIKALRVLANSKKTLL